MITLFHVLEKNHCGERNTVYPKDSKDCGDLDLWCQSELPAASEFFIGLDTDSCSLAAVDCKLHGLNGLCGIQSGV